MEVVEFFLDRLCDKKRQDKEVSRALGTNGGLFSGTFARNCVGEGGGEVRRTYLGRHPDSEMNQGNCKQRPGK